MTPDSRKGRILQAIVNDYVEIADPIGSEWLVAHYDFGCKSATLRNEMAEMSEQGYLVQPHTSAGRIPSDRGYRYYVDRLMTTTPVPETEKRRALSACSKAQAAVEEIIQQTCRILSSMTQYPSVATTPSLNATTLHRLYLTPASPRHVLLVLLLSTGHVENRLLALGFTSAEDVLQRVANYLNETLAGHELDTIARRALGDVPEELHAEAALLGKVYAVVVQAARALEENPVFLEGTSHILRQREFQDVLRLEQLLSALEQRSVLFQVLSRALLGQDVTVIIGAESRIEAMQECSVVTSPYHIGTRTSGFIGVVGPTRMRYDRAFAAVGLMARNLSALLTRASLG